MGKNYILNTAYEYSNQHIIVHKCIPSPNGKQWDLLFVQANIFWYAILICPLLLFFHFVERDEQKEHIDTSLQCSAGDETINKPQKGKTNLPIAPRPWLPNTSSCMLSFSTASHTASLGSPTSVTVSADICSNTVEEYYHYCI